MPKRDVFISYSHDDRLILDELLEEFRKEQIEYITDETFTFGRNIEKMIAEAIDNARHTALLLTPRWRTSRWTSYEAMFAMVRDRDGDLGLLLPLLYEDVDDMPDLLRPLLHADLRCVEKRAAVIARVIDTIRNSRMSPLAFPLEPEDEPVRARSAVKALERLAEVADNMPVREHLAEFREHIAKSAEEIQLLADLKDVHEQLHQMQLRFYAVTGSKIGVADPSPFANRYAMALENALKELQTIATRTSFAPNELSWVNDLRHYHEELVAAILAGDQEATRDVIDFIEHLLAENSGFVNTSLRMVLRHLRLPDLVVAIDAVCAHADTLLLTTDRDVLLDGLRTLRRLARNVSALITDHDGWQRADTSLRLVDRTLHEKINDLLVTWPRMAKEIAKLDRSTPSPTLESARTALEKAIGDRNRNAAWEPYQLVRGYTIDCFYNVDRLLKRQCDELRFIGGPLAELSRKLA